MEVTSEDHPDLIIYLNNLGNKFQSRFERTGRMEDLEETIRKKALNLSRLSSAKERK